MQQICELEKRNKIKGKLLGRGYTKEDWDEVSDNPELTDEELAQGKPFAEMFPGVTLVNASDAHTRALSDLLADAVKSEDPHHLAIALGTIARAKGMSAVAKEAGVTREALYKALSADGDPRLSTLFGVVRALGLKLTISAP